ncbi:hypothetical protein SCA6_019731 [Theobroma cacao]
MPSFSTCCMSCKSESLQCSCLENTTCLKCYKCEGPSCPACACCCYGPFFHKFKKLAPSKLSFIRKFSYKTLIKYLDKDKNNPFYVHAMKLHWQGVCLQESMLPENITFTLFSDSAF